MLRRKPFVGGNWKMNLHCADAVKLAASLAERGDIVQQTDVAIYPASVHLERVAREIADTPIQLGGQNFFHEPNGAFTGEVSLSMLADCGVTIVLVGHSERRHVFGESDSLVNEKVLAALEAGMHVVLCVGETIQQRDAGETDKINAAQLGLGLAGVRVEQMTRVTIAYEPVWAIGTGQTATASDAQAAHDCLRRVIQLDFDSDSEVGDAVRIQYGGSVKATNAPQLAGEPDIDGFLVGGASLVADDFLAIIEATARP